jgi:hypothetical protein
MILGRKTGYENVSPPPYFAKIRRQEAFSCPVKNYVISKKLKYYAFCHVLTTFPCYNITLTPYLECESIKADNLF